MFSFTIYFGAAAVFAKAQKMPHPQHYCFIFYLKERFPYLFYRHLLTNPNYNSHRDDAATVFAKAQKNATSAALLLGKVNLGKIYQ